MIPPSAFGPSSSAPPAGALGEKRFQAFLDSVARTTAKGADNDNEPPVADKANVA
ncbi:MAG: hypothetical protein ACRD2F_00330 [Terriglobales bacterium]